MLFTSWHSVLLYPYVCSSLLEVLWSGICSTVHTSYSTFLTNPRFVIIPSQRFAQPPLLFLSLNFQQLSTEKNQFSFVIPCLASHMSRNKSEIICYPAAKIWPPPSLLSFWPYLQSIRRPDLQWKRPPRIYNPTSSKELFDDYFAQSFLFMGTLAATSCCVQIFCIINFLFTTQSFWKFFEAAIKV